jgi:V/A-type H+/Na+-transporting ATPase subunit I
LIDLLRTEPMQKIRIVSLEADKGILVAALHTMGVIDLRKSKLELSDDRAASYATDVSDSLIRVNGALQLLTPQKVTPEKHIPLNALLEQVKNLSVLGQTYDLGNERKALTDDNKAIDYAAHIATSFSGVAINFSKLRSEYVLYRAFETDVKGARTFESRIRKAAGHIELNVTKTGKNEYLMLVTYDKRMSIDNLYKGLKINELDLGARYLEGSPGSIIRNVGAKKKENEKRLAEISGELARISVKNYSRLANLREMLEIEFARSEVSTTFKRTDHTFVVEGWVQKRLVKEIEAKLQAMTKNKIIIEELKGDELAPTHTRRPRFLQPFDYLVNFYSVQRSDEIDPTWIFILSFPIFYGLMVTDVGYGLASLLLATIIAKKYNDPDGLLYNAAKIWQLCAVAAIVFGLLSNQWFGFQLDSYVGLAQGQFDWLKNTPALIAITVIFGILQVELGLLLGIFNSYSHGHKKLAIARFASMLVVAFGTIAVAGFFFNAFGLELSEISAGISILSLLLTVAFSGSEATEVVNLITHPLSYARLMGFGLASVIIAFLIDMSFTPHWSTSLTGILVFAVYLVIFIALHFLNMILSMFEGIVQGVRLNFVEFFSKFYIGNGIPFRPFSYKRVYTKEE